MAIRTLFHHSLSLISLQNPNFNNCTFYSLSIIPSNKPSLHLLTPPIHSSRFPSCLRLSKPKCRRIRYICNCISINHDILDNNPEAHIGNDSNIASVSSFQEEEEAVEVDVKREGLEDQSIWNQMKEIVMFTGPATGLWLCGPLMSLIDTSVNGQGSSIKLAALVATSNLVATSLARQDKNEVQHQISILLFIGLACGIFMFYKILWFMGINW